MFVETFVQKCEDNEYAKGHCTKPFIVKAVSTMFNIVAKNMVAKRNSEIHKKRKRKVNINDAKKSSSERKLKKLTSN